MPPGKKVLYHPHGEVSFHDIAKKIHKEDIGKSSSYYRARWIAFGKPESVNESMFTMSISEVKEATGSTGFSGGRIKGVASDARYLNPGFLPHIPFGDLAHLSGSRNTGAARPVQEVGA